MRQRPGYKQVSWWLPEKLLADLKECQHRQRVDNLTDIARILLEQGVAECLARAEKGSH